MERNFELFMGCLGNGITVCNKAVYENGDYKHVARIEKHGKITLYVSSDYIPPDAMKRIRNVADKQKKDFKLQWEPVPIMSKYQRLMDQLPVTEFLIVAHQNDWNMEEKVKYAELIVYGVLAESLTEAVYPFRYKWDIASLMIQKADCEKVERIKTMAWLKKFHDELKKED